MNDTHDDGSSGDEYVARANRQLDKCRERGRASLADVEALHNDVEELAEQLAAATARAKEAHARIAELGVEWGVRLPDNQIEICDSETDAREWAGQDWPAGSGLTVMCRDASRWRDAVAADAVSDGRSGPVARSEIQGAGDVSEPLSEERLEEIRAAAQQYRGSLSVRNKPNGAIAHRGELLAEVDRLRRDCGSRPRQREERSRTMSDTHDAGSSGDVADRIGRIADQIDAALDELRGLHGANRAKRGISAAVAALRGTAEEARQLLAAATACAEEARIAKLGRDAVAPDAAQGGLSATETDDAAPCAQSCRSEEGITVGLVDAIIGILRVLAPRDLRPKTVQEALADLSADPDLQTVRAALAPRTELDHVDGEADRG